MNDQTLTKARIAVKSILDFLDVVRVVYVDDANDRIVSLEKVTIAAGKLNKKQLLITFPEFGESLPDDPDIVRQKIHNVWRQLDENEKNERGQSLLIAARRQDNNDDDDVAYASILNDLIPQEILLNLSPSQWEVQKKSLLDENQDKRTMFLFDRDFSEAGGDPEGGIKIIASLLAGNDSGSLICGLLTHTITPETQPQQWEELSRTHNIPRDRFVVIPKLHLSKDPILFAQILKFAALSPDFDKLKRKTKEIIATAFTAAANRVNEVSIYDFEHIVFQVSADEGLWEPDMLFRLHALFHRNESRRLAHEGGTLETITAKLRAVSGIPTQCDQFVSPSSTWALQREELYESDDYINKYHLPLEVGDIFERVCTGSNKRYVLLAQPCDLMVRNDGKRHPDLLRVPLAELVSKEEPPYFSEKLPYYGKSPTEKWFVKFKQVRFVHTCVLDLCVFNKDGVARLIVDGSVTAGIRPPWETRYKILSTNMGKKVRKWEIIKTLPSDSNEIKQFKQNINQNIKKLIFEDELFKGEFSDVDEVRTVTFDCKRVGRISRARAIGLLMSYTSSLARPAYDRDFGKVENAET